MLIIGHRGAAGLAPENTLKSLQAGIEAGADILEFDIRITKDNIPVLCHDATLHGKRINHHTYNQLANIAPITTLREVLDDYFGKVLLNIELKESSKVSVVYEMVKLYISRPEDWDNVLFSSFKPQTLVLLRGFSDHLNLALLHHINPFVYMRYHRRLNLTAVGFHRLRINPIALAVAKELGLFTYVYTVDRSDTALRIEQKGIDGIVTNYPDKISEALQAAV